MGLLVAGLAGRAARIAHQLTTQIVVSVATAVCVALISNAYLRHDSSPPQAAPTPSVLTEREGRATTVIAKKAARLPAVDGGTAERAAPPTVARTKSLPKLEAVYIPTIPPAAMPVVAMQPPAMPAIEPSVQTPPTFIAVAGDMPGPVAEETKRVRLLGIPLPGVGAARDRIAALFNGNR